MLDCRRDCRLHGTRNGAPKGRGGPPHKQLPRKRLPADLRSLARGHTELCIRTLAGIVSQEAVPPAARVAAAGILLDRGWGRASQSITGENGEGGIEVIIRHIVDGAEQRRPVPIDAAPSSTD